MVRIFGRVDLPHTHQKKEGQSSTHHQPIPAAFWQKACRTPESVRMHTPMLCRHRCTSRGRYVYIHILYIYTLCVCIYTRKEKNTQRLCHHSQVVPLPFLKEKYLLYHNHTTLSYQMSSNDTLENGERRKCGNLACVS